MKLYSLTYENKNFVSCLAPSNLPEDNFCYVEILYENKSVKEIKGKYSKDGEVKECVLSDLDISKYVISLSDFLTREDIDKDKIHLNFVENITDENERILKIFIILLSSYLVYFNFLSFPFAISLDLLSNEKLKYFTSFCPMNDLEISFFEQVSFFHRYFSLIFASIQEDGIISEIKEYKRRFIADIDKKVDLFKPDLFTIKNDILDIKKRLSEVLKNF